MQILRKMKGDMEMSEIKVLEEIGYTGKFSDGSKVRVIGTTDKADKRVLKLLGAIGVVDHIDLYDKKYPYRVYFKDVTEIGWFNESELELVDDTINNNIPDRPASSHYHIDNNGNDVWQFADDNLSDERVKGFHQINAIKYVARYEKKHDTAEKRIEDLEKAKVSIDKLIELEGKSMSSKGCDVVEE